MNSSDLLRGRASGDGLFDGPGEGFDQPVVAAAGVDLLDACVDLDGEVVGDPKFDGFRHAADTSTMSSPRITASITGMTLIALSEREIARYWSLVQKNPASAGGCWIWLGVASGKTPKFCEYGRAGRQLRGARIAWELQHGGIPHGRHVMSVCGEILCVNPAHLVLCASNEARDEHVKRSPAEDRFWAKVNKQDGCWEWTGAHDSNGYGHFRLTRQRLVATHRFSYELLVGPIPDGLTIDHLCRNRRCVNPDHLEPVTARVNILRSYNPAAMQARQTHCKRGLHELAPAEPGKKRLCKPCQREKRRRQAGTWVEGNA